MAIRLPPGGHYAIFGETEINCLRRLYMNKERIDHFLKRLDELETQFGNKALLDAVREGFMAIFGSEDTSGAPAVCEGIDLDLSQKTVAYNPNHTRFVDTRETDMMPVTSRITFRVLNTDKKAEYPVISIFGRNSDDGGTGKDGNPLIFALKGERNWKFSSDSDRDAILNQALNVAKNLFARHHIDTVVFSPSTNPLNKQISEIVAKACPDAVMLPETAIRKKKTSEVLGSLDYDWIRYILGHYDPVVRRYGRDDPRWEAYVDEQEDNIHQWMHQMGEIFTYHHLPMPYRKAIPQSAELGDICEDDVLINDRDIAIIDDTLTTGKTLSDISELILGTYVPKSITFITLFSAKDGIELNTEVPTENWRQNLH